MYYKELAKHAELSKVTTVLFNKFDVLCPVKDATQAQQEMAEAAIRAKAEIASLRIIWESPLRTRRGESGKGGRRASAMRNGVGPGNVWHQAIHGKSSRITGQGAAALP